MATVSQACHEDSASRNPLETADSHPLSQGTDELGATPLVGTKLGSSTSATLFTVDGSSSVTNNSHARAPLSYFDLKNLSERRDKAQRLEGSSTQAPSESEDGTGTSFAGEDDVGREGGSEPDLALSASEADGYESDRQRFESELSPGPLSPNLTLYAAPVPQAPHALASQRSTGSSNQTPMRWVSSRQMRREGALSPLGTSAVDFTPQQKPRQLPLFLDEDDFDEVEKVPGPNMSLLNLVHQMSAKEIGRYVESFGETRRQGEELHLVLSPSPSFSVARGSSRPSNNLSEHVEQETDQAPEIALLRIMSQTLAQSMVETETLRRQLAEERDKHEQEAEFQRQQHEAREDALKGLCAQHGIGAGEISRCLVRAPTFDAEASRRWKEAKQAGARGRSVNQMTKAEEAPTKRGGTGFGKLDDSSLPQSLQEAMLEDMDVPSSIREPSSPSGRISIRREQSPGSISSSKTHASMASSKASLDGRGKSSLAAAAAESKPARTSSMGARSTKLDDKEKGVARPPVFRTASHTSTTSLPAGGLSDWASGLMPWSGGAGRKAAASTAASNVKATSPGRTRSAEPMASGEDDAIPDSQRVNSDSALDETVESRGAAIEHGDPRPSTISSPSPVDSITNRARSASKSGMGLFGSLAWRRKRPTPEAVGAVGGSSRASSISQITSGPSDSIAEEDQDTNHKGGADGVLYVDGQPAADLGGRNSEKAGQSSAHDPKSAAMPIVPSSSYVRDVGQVSDEVIETASVSPASESIHSQREKRSNGLPKPTHFRAIFLATRVMTSDPSSLLYDSGRRTSELIASLAMSLVGTARSEGKVIEEPSRSIGGRRTPGPGPKTRPNSAAQLHLSKAAGEHWRATESAAATITAATSSQSVTKANPGKAAVTISRALGRYQSPASGASAKSRLEPNVTTLPDLYRFSGQGTGAGESRTLTKLKSSDSLTARSPKPPAAAVELEPIVPLGAKPPTLAILNKRRKTVHKSTALSKTTKPSNGAHSKLGPLDEESSGDEFEVYGGKGQVPGFQTKPLADEDKMTGQTSSEEESDEENELLTDRYGFIYDATPSDIRLLRQARKAATPAPACLTGIRVGVRARGGSDSQSEEDKEDPDLIDPDSDEDAERCSASEGTEGQGNDSLANGSGSADGAAVVANESIQPSTSDSTSMKSAGSVSSKKSAAKASQGLLSVSRSKPVAEALSLSVASQSSMLSGPTSPTQELHFKQFGTGSEDLPAPSVSQNGADRRPPPSSSQTVRRLLTQLQNMHEEQQDSQKKEWDEFLQRRRERLIRGSIEGSSSSASAARRAAGAGIPPSSIGAGFSSSLGSEKEPEEVWSQGMVGINRMGDSKAGKEDWRAFLRLCQAGIPLCYRAKIWAECSGANELAEPGRYQELLNEHEGETNQCLIQIDLDVHRTMPTNIFFGGDGQGIPKLRRLLVAFSWYNPQCGYCQGMNNLAATLLLTHATEEEAFWVLVCIIEKILPSEYYTSHLLVSQADQRVLIELVEELMPDLAAHISGLGVDLPAVTFAWFLSLYTDCLPVETLFRVWDVMFVEGMVILFRVAIAILMLNERDLLATTSAAAFYGQVHSMTSRLFSVDRLIKLACEDLKHSIRYAIILDKRERHVAGEFVPAWGEFLGRTPAALFPSLG
ncbi:TBC-domain-containing protein [Violaceomyces palustris]|uniref:TBC-domain-containing protein n=1 Tax=Violaceomyces palustris TaxID=1673888 RepID=A0ACD0NT86_9BASI|nr:TBC-domain-containing protein [Violaceomyces palustris]